MRYAIMITGAPLSGALSKAHQFCHTLLTLQHRIGIVFFYHESVLLLKGQNSLSPALSKGGDLQQWQVLQQAYSLSYHLCSTSAARYSIESPETLGFSLSGLGVWSQEMGLADRVILFKGGDE